MKTQEKIETIVTLVRHAEKGDGTNAPKNHLSPKGEADATTLGANLPESMKTGPITHVGGSVHSRSTYTAMRIALGAGADPLVLPSRFELGSEKQFWSMTTLEAFNEAMAANGKNMMAATRAILTEADFAMLQAQMIDVVLEYGKLGGNIVIGTHNPWIQLFYEAITGTEYNGNAAELDYVVVKVADGKISLVETSLK